MMLPVRAALCVYFLITFYVNSTSAQDRHAFSLEEEHIAVQVVPLRETTVVTEISGRLETLRYREGERFAEGALLAVFDCKAQSAQKERAEAQVEAASVTWRSAEALEELNAVGRLEVESSAAEVAIAEAELRYLKVLLQKCQLSAPYSGAVDVVHAREGQFLQAGTPVIDIIDDGALMVEFIVPTRWLVWLTPGFELDVYIEDTDRAYPVRLLRMARRADPLSQSVKGFAEFVALDDELLAGMSGYLQMPAAGGIDKP